MSQESTQRQSVGIYPYPVQQVVKGGIITGVTPVLDIDTVISQAVGVAYSILDNSNEDPLIVPGPAGRDGVIGRDGVSGPPGMDGYDGEDPIFIPGPQGIPGPSGTDLAFGSMYADNTSTNVAFLAADTFVQIASGMTGGALNLCSFQNNREIVVNPAGNYLITYSVSVDTGPTNKEIEAGIMINGVASVQGTAHTEVSTGGANRPQVISGTAIFNLAAGSVISLALANHTDTTTVVVSHASMSIVRAGGMGIQGIQGVQGIPGLAIVTYADDPDEPLIIPGPPGIRGADGVAGVAGSPGISIPIEPNDPEDPLAVPGAQGPSGSQGPTGPGTAVYINLINHFTTLENTTSASATWKIPAATTYGQIAAPLDMTKLPTPTSAEFYVVYTNTASSGTNRIGLVLSATPQAAGTTVVPFASSQVTMANSSTYPQTIRQALTVAELGSTAQWLQWALNIASSSVGPNVFSLGLILYYN